MINFKNFAHEIDLDLSDNEFIPKINMKQYDTKSRFIKARLYSKGQEFDISDKDLSFKAIFRKPDDTEVFISCEVTTGSENYITIPIEANTLSAVGNIIVELVIMQNGEIFSSKFFYINCLESLHANKGAIESNSDYKGLLESILKVEQLLLELKNLNTIAMLHHVINVSQDNKTISFSNWNEYEANNDVEVYLSGVKQIKGIDFTLNSSAKTITTIGDKTFKNGDQVLLCTFRRAHSTEYNNPTIGANNVTLTSNILGANNVQSALGNILVKLNDYLLVSQYTNEVGNINHLRTDEKIIVNAINELKTRLDKLDGGGGTTITTYKKLTETTILTQPTKSIVVPIDDYNSIEDELNVYISGAKMVENVAYTLNKQLKTITCVDGTWNENIQIYFEVIKFK